MTSRPACSPPTASGILIATAAAAAGTNHLFRARMPRPTTLSRIWLVTGTLLSFVLGVTQSLQLAGPTGQPLQSIRNSLKRSYRRLDEHEEAARRRQRPIELRLPPPYMLALNETTIVSPVVLNPVEVQHRHELADSIQKHLHLEEELGQISGDNPAVKPHPRFRRRWWGRLLRRRRPNVGSLSPSTALDVSELHNHDTVHAATTNSEAATATRPVVTDVHELRHRVLDQQQELKSLQVALDVVNMTNAQLAQHNVIQLMVARFQTQSTPGHRAENDTAQLALSIEGGGMRGAVSAGMAAALACLGLSDSFDAVYGSSAGSVIGAYLVSRQMCLDVYVDILPAAQRTFVCAQRMLRALAVTGLDWALSPMTARLGKFAARTRPGMNISFVLDGIMDHEHGIRPLDMDRFLANDARQPLRIASSYVHNGTLGIKCFGRDDFDRVRKADGSRTGIYTCLEASMTVPGATGPPVMIDDGTNVVPYFDAFCFEPLPYRSAVEENATHVFVLCSKPEGSQPKSRPGIYERAIAPLYFRSYGEPTVARFFERGGQQYLYAEDLLTLEQGKRAGVAPNASPIVVPPPRLLYGVDHDNAPSAGDRDSWKSAHLFPMKVPYGTPELATLEQGRVLVLDAVRGGFAATFDLLAPPMGVRAAMTGHEVAELVFPDECLYDEFLLETQLRVSGDAIPEAAVRALPTRRRKRDRVLAVVRRLLRRGRGRLEQNALPAVSTVTEAFEMVYNDDAQLLLGTLPGFQSGKMAHLALALRERGAALAARNLTVS